MEERATLTGGLIPSLSILLELAPLTHLGMEPLVEVASVAEVAEEAVVDALSVPCNYKVGIVSSSQFCQISWKRVFDSCI